MGDSEADYDPSSTATILFVLIIALNTLIVAPFSFYYTSVFWSKRAHSVIEKRRPRLVVLTIAVALFYLIIIRLITCLPFLISDPPSFLINTHWQLSWKFFVSIVWGCLSIKTWLTFYDFQKSLQILDAEWAQKINTDNGAQLPWTIEYADFVGNSSFLFILLGFYILLMEIFLNIIISVSSESITVMITVPLMMAVIIIPMVYSGFKIHSFQDVFFIRNEVFSLLVCWVVLCVGLIVIYSGVIKAEYWIDFMDYCLTTLFTIAILYYTVARPTSLLKNFVFYQSQRDLRSEIRKSSRPSSIGQSGISQSEISHESQIELAPGGVANADNSVVEGALRCLLEDERGFKVYSQHLTREFSVEDLLFLLQYMQFKKQMIISSLVTEDKHGWRIDFPDSVLKQHGMVRKSSSMTHQQCIARFKFLYDQYLGVASPLRVQIPQMVVLGATSTINEVCELSSYGMVADEAMVSSRIKLIQMFDLCARGVFMEMIRSSFYRFATTPEYNRYQQTVPPNP